MAVARYRKRHRSARAKSDHADAMTLANILRTDADMHRPLPADSELVRAIAVLARAQQDTVWNRTQLNNQLRSHLKQYYPAALAAFGVRGVGLDSREARAVLAMAPDPNAAARPTRAQLRAALRRSGRQRNIEVWVERLRTILTGDYLHQPPLVEQAMGQQTLALVAQWDAACRAADDLAEAAAEAFATHPDAEILGSFPVIGPLTGARVLAETGDDRTRFADARALKAYAGSAPVTIASGKSHLVRHRRVKAWQPQAMYGSSAHCPPHRSRPNTIDAGNSGTGTPPPCATSSTASWDASTTACRPDGSSILARRSPPRPRRR